MDNFFPNKIRKKMEQLKKEQIEIEIEFLFHKN